MGHAPGVIPVLNKSPEAFEGSVPGCVRMMLEVVTSPTRFIQHLEISLMKEHPTLNPKP